MRWMMWRAISARPHRLVTSGSVEEDILERAKQKMVLDHLAGLHGYPNALSTTSSTIF